MVETINAQNSAKTPDLKKHLGVGTLVGAATGGATSAGLSICAISQIKKGILTQDQFIAQQKELIEGMPDGALKEAFKDTMQDAKSAYKTYQECMQNLLTEAKKAAPKTIAKGAAIVGAIGAAIGGIVYLVKKSQANKAQETQQQ